MEAARKIYQGPTHARTGAELYSPLYPGSELGWGQLAGGEQPLGIPVEFFKFYVLRDPAWDYRTRPLNYDSDVTASDRPEIQPVNAVDPDLRRFFARGGKLLLVGGWNDAAVPPKVAINYFNRVVATVGERQTRESMRFFMVPGMGHGPGTGGAENFDFDALSLIEQWKERGVVPETLIVGALQGRQARRARALSVSTREWRPTGATASTRKTRPASSAARSRSSPVFASRIDAAATGPLHRVYMDVVWFSQLPNACDRASSISSATAWPPNAATTGPMTPSVR